MKGIAGAGVFAMVLTFGSPAFAGPILPTTARLTGELTSGPLHGSPVFGSFAYDAAQVTGNGQEFLPLLDFDVELQGVHFNRDDIRQGGQVLFRDGAFESVTAAFFPPPPADAPVSDIAFGFGGPGVIGYVASGEFGAGAFDVSVSPTPEPSTIVMVIIGLLVTTCSTRLTLRARADSNA